MAKAKVATSPFNEDHTLNMPVVQMPFDWPLTYMALFAFLHKEETPDGNSDSGT